MTKILTVFTGGTIGSVIEDDTIDVNTVTNREIINGFYAANPDSTVVFTQVQPFNILSENFTPSYWARLYDCIKQAVKEDHYDGVIITHGSDTISYTASFVAFTFSDTPIPIVLTCSNYVLSNPLSNGQSNFNNAVNLVCSRICGIFVVYQDKYLRNKVYCASRLQEANPYDDQFTVCGGIELGEVIDGKFVLNNNARMLLTQQQPSPITFDNLSFDKHVCAIKAYPGLNYRNYTFVDNTAAVLCNLYHSSSNCIMSDDFSLINFIEKCKKQNVDVYLMSFKKIEGEMYNTTKQIVKAGGIPLVNISFEASYVKLNLAYNQTQMTPAQFMQTEIYHETI